MSSVICFNLDQSKILSSGNWLTHYNDYDGILDLSTFKMFADDLSSERVVNTVRKEKVFFFFPTMLFISVLLKLRNR